MALLTVQNLTLSFGERTLFSDVSFDVKEGEKVGFVGANGVGKTTLFKVITGELQPDEGGVFTGKNVRVGYMEQHTCSAENTVWDELVSGFSDLIAMEQELHDISLALQNGSGASGGLLRRGW